LIWWGKYSGDGPGNLLKIVEVLRSAHLAELLEGLHHLVSVQIIKDFFHLTIE
jgi:hypothetical protein